MEQGLANLQSLKTSLDEYVASLETIKTRIKQYEVYTQKNKAEILQIKNDLLDICGRGFWVEHALEKSKKSELIHKIDLFADRLICEKVLDGLKLDAKITRIQAELANPINIALKKIHNDEAELIGEGPWVKDSAYRVYKVDGKYFTIIVYNQMNLDLMDDSIKEIKEEEIIQYI